MTLLAETKPCSRGLGRLRQVLPKLEHPTFLAPMEGVTSPEFRHQVAERGGVGVVCTEFVRVPAAPLNKKSLRDEVQRTPHALLSVQVMGNDIEKMAEAALALSECDLDAIDLNVGCPMPKIVRKGVGAALLKQPEILRSLVTEMRKVCKGPLSAKIRAGYDDSQDSTSIAKMLEDSGVDYLAIHARRRCDFYSGVADWRIIRSISQAVSIPVLGNGDVWYADDFERMLRETGCDGVMAGRGIIRNPWLFTQALALSQGVPCHVPDGKELCQELETELIEIKRTSKDSDPKRISGVLKQILRFRLRGIPNNQELSQKLLRLDDAEKILRGFEDAVVGHSSSELDFGLSTGPHLESSGTCTDVREA